MEIKVKYNIDFKKILKIISRKKGLEKSLNKHFAPKTVKLAQKYIDSGKVKPELKPITLKQRNKHFGVTHKKPLLMTGKLKDSLKGNMKGISGVNYAKEHRAGYTWSKPHNIKGYKVIPKPIVEAREFIPHLKDGLAVLSGTKSDITKIYKEYQDKFVKLLNKRLRKK